MALSDDMRAGIRAELASMRGELIERMGGIRADTEWSAHANWKSSKMGDFDIQSRLVVPQGGTVPSQIEKLIEESRSANLVEVSRRLSEVVK